MRSALRMAEVGEYVFVSCRDAYSAALDEKVRNGKRSVGKRKYTHGGMRRTTKIPNRCRKGRVEADSKEMH